MNEREKLLQGALETIDAIGAIAASGCYTTVDMAEIDDIIVSFRKAHPNSHSDMAREEAKSRPDITC